MSSTDLFGADYIEYGGKLLNIAREALKLDQSLARTSKLRDLLTTAIKTNSPPPDGMERAQIDRARDLAIAEARREHIVATIDRLRILDEVEYESCRLDEARRLGVRVNYLDEQVRAGDKIRSRVQGRALDLKTPEPWLDPVDGVVLLEELVSTITRYMVLPPGAAVAIALWVILTYVIECFDVAPRLAILSATMRSGKTTMMLILAHLVLRPLFASNISPAAVFRIIEAASPSLLIDEADSFAGNNEELRGLLNSGHTRDAAFIVRVEGDQHEPRRFSTWGLIAVAAIGTLPATWMDRSIVIKLKRKRPNESAERLTRDNRGELDKLAQKCARWAADNAAALNAAKPGPATGLNDRALDNWRPLFAIAEATGGQWPDQALAAAAALAGESETSDSLNIILLRDLRTLFQTEPDRARWGSTDLCRALAEIETSPWATLARDKPVTPAKLARMLRGFEIYVRQGNTGSYYQISDFDDAFDRYLPDPVSQTATMPQPHGAEPLKEFSMCHVKNNRGTSRSATNPTENDVDGSVAPSDTLAEDVMEF
jgi:putative DNA primase/helicase